MAPAFLKNLDIRTRLLLLCLAVAMPLLITCGLVIFKEYQGLSQVAKRATTYYNQLATRTLNAWLTTQENQLKLLSGVLPLDEGSSAVKRLLLSQVNQEQDCQGLAVYDLDGRVIATTGGDQKQWHPASNVLNAVNAGKSFVSGYTMCPITGKNAILLVQPIGEPAHPTAMLVESLDPDGILRLFAGLNQAPGFVISIVDADKRVIARTLENKRWQGKDFTHARTVTAAARALRGTIEVVGIADKTQRTYSFDRIASTGWLVIVGIPTQAIYGSALDRLITLALCAAVAASLVLGSAFAFTRHFTGPIHELVREAVALGRGDLSKRVQTAQGGELGLLARAFNQMALNLELNREHKAMIEQISESVRQSLDTNQILNTAVVELGRALDASRCCLALIESAGRDIAGKQLEFDYVWFNDKLGGTALKNRSILITEGSILKIILEQRAILSLDVMDDSTFAPMFESSDDSPEDWRSIKSLIACPIILNQQPIGMILVHQCDRLRVWFDLELELVEAVARHVALALDHGQLFARAREMADQQVLINQIVRATRGSLDADTILDTVTRELGTALGADYCQIAEPRPEGPLVVTHEYHREELPSRKNLSLYGSRMDFHPQTATPQDLRSVLGVDLSELPGKAAFAQSPLQLEQAPIAVISDVAGDRRALMFSDYLETVGSQSVLAAPLLQDDRVLGMLVVHQCRKRRDWQDSEVRLIATVADQLAVAISHAQLFEQVKHQAITDGLTGLYNHIYFKNRLAEELNRAQRKGTGCSLLMLDLDKLKEINDTYGHPIGDAAIRQVSSVLRSLLRSGDTAARYGGEEFAVILPETPLGEAVLIADRLRRNINRNPVPGLGHVSASIGAACFPTQAEALEELVDKADRALYAAKRSGRNKVCVYDDVAPQLVREDASPGVTEPPGGKAGAGRTDAPSAAAPRTGLEEPAGS